MNTEGEADQTKNVEELYWDVRDWKSELRFMEDQIRFIDGLLDSYVFEPDTPNLFHRLKDYQRRLTTAKNKKRKVWKLISRHMDYLEGMLDRKDKTPDPNFFQKHNALKTEVVGFVENFQILKGEIFNYARVILKKGKPKD